MKKMKKAVAFEASLPVVVRHEDARIRFKHQSLMQDYEELEKVNIYFSSLDLSLSLWIWCLLFILGF